MKCVAAGDVFITPEMMKIALDKYPEIVTDAQYFFFGENTKKEMRNTVKKIEHYERETIPVPEGFEDALKDAEMVIVHLCPVTRKIIESAPKLKYILCNRGGVENVDVDAATERGIMLLHNPAHNANAVAEFAVGVMFAEMRNIVRANVALKEGVWREKFPNSGKIIELRNLTVGIVGFGNVGELLCEKLNGFGCEVLVYDLREPRRDNPRINYDKVKFVDFDYLVKNSDVITLHARSSSVIFGAREFSMMKESAYFINTSRSCMVDYDALYDALAAEKIRGAAIDVFNTEPLGLENPFLKLDNVTLTNHRGGDTLNSYSDSPLMMMAELADFLHKAKSPRYWYNRSK